MGGRAGGGARGGGGAAGAQVSGFTKAPFPGAVKAGSLKAGDKIKGADGSISHVLKVDKLGKGKILVTTKIGDQSFGNVTTPGRYLNGTKV